MPDRHTMTPAEFDAACRELLRRHPTLSEVSGQRSKERNKSVGGSSVSKHLYGLAKDFVADPPDYRGKTSTCIALGLWFVVHDKSSGDHLHVQGAAPGPLPEWWVEKYWHE